MDLSQVFASFPHRQVHLRAVSSSGTLGRRIGPTIVPYLRTEGFSWQYLLYTKRRQLRVAPVGLTESCEYV